MLSMDPTLNDLPSEHASPLYRLYRDNPSKNLTKSPTLTLTLQLKASASPSWTRSLTCLVYNSHTLASTLNACKTKCN